MLDSFCHHLLWSLVISPEHEVSLCPSSVRLYVCQQWLKKTSLKLLGQIQWNITGSFFGWPSPKTTTRHHDWPTTKTTELSTSCFALKNIYSETTRQNAMTNHRKLLWMTVYKNTTRRHDWPTTTTKCLTCIFALKNMFS